MEVDRGFLSFRERKTRSLKYTRVGPSCSILLSKSNLQIHSTTLVRALAYFPKLFKKGGAEIFVQSIEGSSNLLSCKGRFKQRQKPTSFRWTNPLLHPRFLTAQAFSETE